MCRCGELSKDQEPSLRHQFCSDCIIATRGYDSREGHLLIFGSLETAKTCASVVPVRRALPVGRALRVSANSRAPLPAGKTWCR
jgi:hypothetical protein